MDDHRPIPADQQGEITAIQRVPQASKRYHVYIDGEYAFSVHEDVLLEFRLLKGKKINPAELALIFQEEEKKKLERTALRYLSYRPRTTREMQDYLTKKQFRQDQISSLLEKWKKEGYLDDEAFARQWVTERMNNQKKGRYLLQHELAQKGIDEAIMTRILDDIDPELERRACLAAAEKKWASLTGLKEDKQKEKLFRYLYGRGFAYDLAASVFKQLRTEHEQ